MSSPLAGAEMMTFDAPASTCLRASSADVNIPVDSTTTVAPTDAQGRSAGSLSAKTGIDVPSTTIAFSAASTGTSMRPRTESYFNRCASVVVSVRSLMPTISTSAPLLSRARKKLRPIRPNPLIPTLMVTQSPRIAVMVVPAGERHEIRCPPSALVRRVLGRDNAYILVTQVTFM